MTDTSQRWVMNQDRPDVNGADFGLEDYDEYGYEDHGDDRKYGEYRYGDHDNDNSYDECGYGDHGNDNGYDECGYEDHGNDNSYDEYESTNWYAKEHGQDDDCGFDDENGYPCE